MLTITDLHMHFGGIRAVNGVSLTIDSGTITGLIGPNGAGKTTLFNIIAGLHKPTSGQVVLDGEDITGLPPHALFHKGMLRTFQIAHEFSTLTVRENLMMVPPHLQQLNPAAGLIRCGHLQCGKPIDLSGHFLMLGQLTQTTLSQNRRPNLSVNETMPFTADSQYLEAIKSFAKPPIKRQSKPLKEQ